MAARAERLTMREAADRFDVSPQAVHSAWQRMYPGESTPGLDQRPEREIVLQMVASHRPLAEVAAASGYREDYVREIARESGLRASTRPTIAAQFEAAIAAVRDGGMSIGEASADHGVSYGALADKLRRIGVRAPKRGRVRNGRAVAAADAVERSGISVAEAARMQRCAPLSVSAVLARRRAMVAA